MPDQVRRDQAYAIRPSNGRPHTFEPELAGQIVKLLRVGETLWSIERSGLIDRMTVADWMADREEFRREIDKARLEQGLRAGEKVLDLAHRIEQGAIGAAQGSAAIKGFAWYAARAAWQQFGDRSAVLVGGTDHVKAVVLESGGDVSLDAQAPSAAPTQTKALTSDSKGATEQV